MDLLLNVSYEFFSLLSCFTTASSLACVAVVSSFFWVIGASKKDARGKKSKKEEEGEEERRGGGGGEKRKWLLSFPPPPHPVPFFLARLFVLASLGLKETETTSTQPTSSRKRPFNPFNHSLKRPALVTYTFFALWGCPLTRTFSVLPYNAWIAMWPSSGIKVQLLLSYHRNPDHQQPSPNSDMAGHKRRLLSI